MGNFISAQLSAVKMNPEMIKDGTEWLERLIESLEEEKSVFDSDVGASAFVVGQPGGRSGGGQNRVDRWLLY
jgi:hypothetical protein